MTISKGYRITVNGIGSGHAPTMDAAKQIAKRMQMLNRPACVRIELLK